MSRIRGSLKGFRRKRTPRSGLSSPGNVYSSDRRPYELPAAIARRFAPRESRWGVPGNTGSLATSSTAGSRRAKQGADRSEARLFVVVAREPNTAVMLLALRAGTQPLADGIMQPPSGRSDGTVWLITRWYPPTWGRSHSPDPEPTIVAGAVAFGAWLGSQSARG